jgi:hypothetical protein
MATTKNKKTLYYALGALLVAGAGYFAYTRYKKKNEELPEPEPQPTPQPSPTPTVTKAASAAKIAEMQNLMIRRFEQLGRSSEYNAAAAKGGWGSKSRTAIAVLMPTNAKNLGDPTAANVDIYIKALSADVATKAAQIKNQETAQQTTEANKKLAAAIVKHSDGGGTVKVLVNFEAPKVIFDKVKNTYIPTTGTMKFTIGDRISKGSLFNRGNGQILYKVGDVRYIINPNYLISQ